MFPAGWGKVPLFLFAMSLLVLVALVDRFFGAQSASADVAPLPPQKKWLRLFLGIFLFANFVTSIVGVYVAKSLWGEQARQNGFLILVHLVLFAFLLGYFFRTRTQWKWFERFLVWSAVLPAVTVLLEALIPAVGALFGEQGRYAAWFGNYLFLGGYLSLATFAAARLFLQSTGWERAASAGAVVLCGIGVFLSGSRGPVLSLVGGGIVFFLFWALFQKRRVAVASGASLLAMALVLFALIQTGKVGSLPTPLRRVFDVSSYAVQNVPRLIQWNIAWRGFLARPLLGWGPENYQTVFDRFYDPKLLRYSFYETVSDKPHNLWLETLATGGVLGAGALLLLIGGCVSCIFFLVRRERLSVVEGGALVGAIAAYVIQATFLFDTLPVSLLLFALYGYVYGLPEASVAEKADLPSRIDAVVSFASVPRSAVRAIAVLGTALLLTANVYAGGLGLIASNATLFSTDPVLLSKNAVDARTLGSALWTPNPYQDELRKYIITSIVNREASGDLSPDFIVRYRDTLLAAAKESAERRPDDFLIQFVYGEALTLAGESAESAELLEQARVVFVGAAALSPNRQAVAVQLAKVLLLGGQPDEAIRLLRGVVDADPTVGDAHWYLALALSASGDDAAAAEEMTAALAHGRKTATVGETQFVIDTFAKAERFEDIAPLYQQLIAGDPKNAVWYARLAATYAVLGKAELAVSAAQTAAQLDQSFAEEAKRFTDQLLENQ
jgi:O-antigen ligase/tetratricopeptide (TPR) repeat protein